MESDPDYKLRKAAGKLPAETFYTADCWFHIGCWLPMRYTRPDAWWSVVCPRCEWNFSGRSSSELVRCNDFVRLTGLVTKITDSEEYERFQQGVKREVE